MSDLKELGIEWRIAVPEDRESIVELYLKLLQYVDQFENDMLPTRKNAEWVTDTFLMPAAARGEPVILVWKDKKLIGGLFWAIQNLVYDVRWKSAYGWGTYLEKEYRTQKIGTFLRKKAIEILKEKGVQKLLGAAVLKNEASLKTNLKLGLKPYMRLDILDLSEKEDSKD